MKFSTNQINVNKIGNVRFLHYPNQSYLTNIKIMTGVGSSAEDSNKGMAHILEHMFFKGSSKRPGATGISRAANDIGAKMNAYTSYDHTAYYISVLNEVFEEGFDILADMYINPLFPEEEFSKELNPILSELREREDDPESFLMERTFEKCFGKEYHPIIGYEETIRSATVEMMHGFKNRFYGGENCLISIVGGISQDTARKYAESFFQNSKKMEESPKKEAHFQEGSLELSKPGIREAYYNLLFPSLPAKHPDRFKQDMMSYLLGGNDSALLFERIREELGMSCYGIYTWTMRNQPFHIMGISCGISVNELEQVHQEVEQQIRRICDSILSQDRLERAKASLRTSIAARAETSSGLNSMIALPVLRGETENPVEKMLIELEKITLEDILESARQTLSGPVFRSVLIPE